MREQLGKRRLRFTDDQPRRLAVRGKKLGRKLLTEIVTLVWSENANVSTSSSCGTIVVVQQATETLAARDHS